MHVHYCHTYPSYILPVLAHEIQCIQCMDALLQYHYTTHAIRTFSYIKNCNNHYETYTIMEFFMTNVLLTEKRSLTYSLGSKISKFASTSNKPSMVEPNNVQRSSADISPKSFEGQNLQ